MTETLHRLRCPYCFEAIVVGDDKLESGYCLKCSRVVNPIRKPPQDRDLELVRRAHLAAWHNKRKGNAGGGVGR
jgi:hypothetical protein